MGFVVCKVSSNVYPDDIQTFDTLQLWRVQASHLLDGADFVSLCAWHVFQSHSAASDHTKPEVQEALPLCV
jgi:hypothetical protein